MEKITEINHFSHEHSLKLIENWKTVVSISDGDDEKKEVTWCCGCQEPILGGFVYGCISCSHFLHEKCANLASVINHHLHPLHPLTLSCSDGDWFCDVCGNWREPRMGFHYRCIDCDFDACTKCGIAVALKEEALTKLKHEGHPQHTLTLQLRSASFHCDACLTKDEDLFYQCYSCDFWLHKNCASLACTINLPHHHHPLVLTYSLPDNFHKFIYFCEFCRKLILKHGWVYHCANCRYFAHIKCALNAEQASIPSDSLGTSLVEEHLNEFLHFPMSKAFTDPLKILHSEMVSLDDDGATEISHWSHDHRLILNVEPQGIDMTVIDCGAPVEVCYGCVRPISLPYYTCRDGCSFSLHKYCAELPLKLKHNLHTDHSLDLVDTFEDEDYYRCNGCFSLGNTFAYKCETCKFYLDVNCGFLPNTIVHKSHKHPLIQVIDPNPRCDTCDGLCNGISYVCTACEFRLDIFCALWSPYFITHPYCKGHEIPLTYPPVEDQTDDLCCDICAKEMNPSLPLYHCRKCEHSFHLDCINRTSDFANVNKEASWLVPYHKHRLVLRKKTSSCVCFACNLDINGRLMFECKTGTCLFSICCSCHLGKIK